MGATRIKICCASLLFAAMLGCLGCQRTRNARIIAEAGRILDTDPDSASRMLARISDPAKLPDAERADYGYLTALAHARCGQAIAGDSMAVFSLDYYLKNGRTERLPLAYLVAAVHRKWRGDLPAYRRMLREGMRLAEERGDSLLLSEMYNHLRSDAYDNRHDLAEAIAAARQTMRYDTTRTAWMSYLIGLAYSDLGQLDSVRYYVERSIALSEAGGDRHLADFARRNYADMISGPGRYAEAIGLLLRNEELPCLSLGLNYLSLGKLDSAQYYVDLIMEQKRQGVEYYMTVDNMVMTLQAVIDYSRGRNIDWGRLGRYNDSIVEKAGRDRRLFEEKVIEQNRLEQRNLELLVGRQRAQLYATWAALLLAVAVVLTVVYVRRKKALLAGAEEKAETLARLLREAAESGDRENAFFRKVLLQQLGLIRLVATTPTAQNQELLKQVSRISNNDVDVDNLLVWHDLYQVVDSVYDGFYSRLTSKYGSLLSDREIQLCCLLCAGFSTKEISVVTQQSLQTVYQRKTTIRRKLGMDEKGDIVGFIRSLPLASDPA